MTIKTGNIMVKSGSGEKVPFAPNTITTRVADPARNQTLAQSLTQLVEQNALGFPPFSTVTPYSEGAVVFYDRRLYKFINAHSAGAWNADDVEELSLRAILAELQDDIEGIKDGDITTGFADIAANLEGWADQDDLSVAGSWSDQHRTTGGSLMIITDKGGQLQRIVPQEDFAVSGLRSSGYNLLRTRENGGIAKQVGSSDYAIPVPKLTFGQYGSAKENNGIVFTNDKHENLTPTVRFVPLSAGEPTSASAGTLLATQSDPQTANALGGIVTDHGIHFYVTPDAGWIIVSGIDFANTCAHIGWEDWYDRYISPSDENDTGDFINLSAIQNALHSDVKRWLALGHGLNLVADQAEWTGEETVKWTRKVGLVTPAWTTEADEVEDGAVQAYTHTAVISGMKSDGQAAFYNDGTAIETAGTNIILKNESATAPIGQVKYELATIATGTISGIKQDYKLDDCGVEILEGMTGSAIVTAMYARNIADALAEIAAHDLDELTEVISEAVLTIIHRIDGLMATLRGEDHVVMNLTADTMNAAEYRRDGFPTEITGAGAPSANVIPDDWESLCPGVAWKGYPLVPGQMYFDRSNNKWYKAKPTITAAVSDWVAL